MWYHHAQSQPISYTNSSWPIIAPVDLSVQCKAGLNELRQHLRTLPTISLVAAVDGKIFFSYGHTNKPSIVYSVRKSLLAMLYGNYVSAGIIDLDKTLAELHIDDIGGLLPVERQATLRDLLSARSGVYHAAANPGDDAKYAPVRGSQLPGSYFLYNNWDFNAAGSAFELLTHQNIYEAFANDIAKPLQLEDFFVERHQRSGDASKSAHLAYHFYLSTRDMARIGELMRQNGRWRDRQIIPADWVKIITTPVTLAAEMHPPRTAKRGLDYGFLWWIPEVTPTSPLAGAYMAWGYYGQYILVVPKRNMVISHKRDVGAEPGGKLNKVSSDEFLRVATMLANSSCN